jgi:hypothetical protein
MIPDITIEKKEVAPQVMVINHLDQKHEVDRGSKSGL